MHVQMPTKRLQIEGLNFVLVGTRSPRFDSAHNAARGFLDFRARRAGCAGPPPRRRSGRAIASRKSRRVHQVSLDEGLSGRVTRESKAPEVDVGGEGLGERAELSTAPGRLICVRNATPLRKRCWPAGKVTARPPAAQSHVIARKSPHSPVSARHSRLPRA